MARILTNFPNIVPPGGDYPYGRLKDNPGDNTGTPVNEFTNGDIHQFFARLMNLAGVASNGNPDNNSNGYQLIEALIKFFNNAPSGALIRTVVIPIGDWNMDAVGVRDVNHGLDSSKIIRADVSIIPDAGGPSNYPLNHSSNGIDFDGCIEFYGAAGSFSDTIRLVRTAGGFFDDSGFDSIGFNRGFIAIDYLLVV